MMKRIALILILLISAGAGSYAQSSSDSVFLAANAHYTNNEYEKAAELYKQLIDNGYQNAALYFNMANTYFKLNRIAQAILNYERAKLLNPNDEDIEFNLEYAKTFTVDRIEPLPEFFAVSWYRNFRGLLSSNAWAFIGLLFFAAAVTFSMFFWFSLRAGLKRINFALAILMLLLMSISFVLSSQEKRRILKRDNAIVFQTVISVKSSPGDTGKDIFILHAGTKVKVTKKLGDWAEIRIADGNKGWIQSQFIEII